MKIGIFGGSFDPVHIEHVRLAEAAISSLGLDKLFIMPASTPPHKQGKRMAPAEDRLQMCRLAFAAYPQVEICDYEIQQAGTSYTYLTCRHFKEIYPDARLFWLVGTDMLRDFPTWKHPERILSDATLAVCSRAEQPDWEEKEQAVFYRRFGKNFAVIHYTASPVSSTQIRVLAGAGMRITHLTDKKVAAYIEKNGLYEIAFIKDALALQKPERAQHSIRVALAAAKVGNTLRIPEEQVLQAALLHDCAKNLTIEHPLLKAFSIDAQYGDVPASVWHQFAGAYLAEHKFGVQDQDVCNAIRFHTSGRAAMSALEQLIFLADIVEDGRTFAGIEELRELFYQGKLQDCMRLALERSLQFLQEKKADVYPLTLQAYAYYQEK